MAVRTTRRVEIPEREQIEERAHNCLTDGPPHNFDQGWGLAKDDDVHADPVPMMFCVACGSIQIMREPSGPVG